MGNLYRVTFIREDSFMVGADSPEEAEEKAELLKTELSVDCPDGSYIVGSRVESINKKGESHVEKGKSS